MKSLSASPVIAILGPTASGKSGLAIDIARAYDGEIVSVDSRQIYRGMNIGTGKVTREEQALVAHHLIDIREPHEDYNVTDFQRDAAHAVADTSQRGKLPILCGGTGFWAQALIENQSFPHVPPDPKLREELTKISKEALFEKLSRLDPKRAETIDRLNPVRLARAIEIATFRNNVSNEQHDRNENALLQNIPFANRIIVALDPPKTMLDAKIKKRLDERFGLGMIDEVRALREQGVSWERLEVFGLEYRWISLFLQQKVAERVMREGLFFAIVHYAKRQRTWLRRWERLGGTIHRVADVSDGRSLVDAFLKK
jgi:tRNA dimethylallyltransferase